MQSGPSTGDQPAETGDWRPSHSTEGPGVSTHGLFEPERLQGISTQNSFKSEAGSEDYVCGLPGEACC